MGDNREINSHISHQEDYYAILNVDRKASQETIRASFAILARSLHPDKRSIIADDYNRKNNENIEDIYVVIDRAYKVLGNPTLRAVYDEFGFEGLEILEGIQASSRFTTKQIQPTSTVLSKYDGLTDSLRQRIVNRIILAADMQDLKRSQIKGALSLDVNATKVWQYNEDALMYIDNMNDGGDQEVGKFFWPYKFQMPEIKRVVVQQSVTNQISQTDSLTTGGFAFVQNGVGAGEMVLVHSHAFSKHSSMESHIQVGTRSNIPNISIKAQRVLTKEMEGEIEFVLNDGSETGLALQLKRRFTNALDGVIRWGLGEEGGLHLQLLHNLVLTNRKQVAERMNPRRAAAARRSSLSSSSTTTPSSSLNNATQEDDDADAWMYAYDLPKTYLQNANAGFRLTPQGSFAFDASYMQTTSKKTRGKIQLRIGTNAVDIEVSTTRTLSKLSKGSIAVSLGVLGVTLKFRYERAGIRFVVPIALTAAPSLRIAIFAGIIPGLIQYGIQQVLIPYFKERRTKKMSDLFNKLIRLRSLAQSQRLMMIPGATMRREAENSPLIDGIAGVLGGGLIIIRARYGQRLGLACSWDEHEIQQTVDGFIYQMNEFKSSKYHIGMPENIDVTEQLQFLVRGSELIISTPTKSELLGFYNPCEGRSSPRLYIRYQFGKRVYEVEYEDYEPISLPSSRAIYIGTKDFPVKWEAR